MNDIVAPFREGRSADIGGHALQPEDDLRIIQTPNPLAFHASKFRKMRGLTRTLVENLSE